MYVRWFFFFFVCEVLFLGYPILFFCVSVFMPLPHCFDYSNFLLSF